MLIWILAIALFVIVGALGYFQGAIRSLVSLVGVFWGALLALPLGPMLRPLVPKVGLTHPIWSWVLPPLVVFVLFLLVFMVVAHLVHRKIMLHYKYRTDDVQRLRWERLNSRLGLGVGVFTGGVYLFLLSLVVYVLGYLTVQISAEEGEPAYLAYLNSARKDLHETGFDKAVAAFDPAPPAYYEVADILGLIYHNPLLHNRISTYPLFLTLVERSEIQEIAGDAELMGKIQSKSSLAEIFKDPKIQALVTNPEIREELRKTDLKDFQHYLETGKSPKYDEEKILGKWQVDPDAVITFAKKMKPDMKAAELIMLKKLSGLLSGITFTATVDNKALLKVNIQTPTPPPDQAAADTAQTQEDASQQLYRDRYGLGRPAPRAAPAPTPAPQPAQPAVPTQFSGQGEWQSEGADRYTISITDDQGNLHTAKAEIKEDELILSAEGQNLVFVKAD